MTTYELANLQNQGSGIPVLYPGDRIDFAGFNASHNDLGLLALTTVLQIDCADPIRSSVIEELANNITPPNVTLLELAHKVAEVKTDIRLDPKNRDNMAKSIKGGLKTGIKPISMELAELTAKDIEINDKLKPLFGWWGNLVVKYTLGKATEVNVPYVVGYYLDRKVLVVKSGPYSGTKFDAIPKEAKSIISNFQKMPAGSLSKGQAKRKGIKQILISEGPNE